MGEAQYEKLELLKSSKKMINIIIGTKAQYIKMMPILKELEGRDIPYRLIDTAQHPEITREIRSTFALPTPDISICSSKKNIDTVLRAFWWYLLIIIKGVRLCRKVIEKGEFCLVHGDTLSTSQGGIIAKFCRAKLVHIEAGERTYNFWKPFPEEIIRRIVDRFSDICFASSEVSNANLLHEKVKGSVVNVKNNTIFDSVLMAAAYEIDVDLPDRYVLVSIHRAETIFSPTRMKIIVETVENIATKNQVIWGLHSVTKKNLLKFGLLDRLTDNNNVLLKGLFDYVSFMKAMGSSMYLITDGGGPQEESYLLNVPCLLMRTETEREYYKNIFLSKFDPERIKEFISDYKKYRLSEKWRGTSPSRLIVDFLAEAQKL